MNQIDFPTSWPNPTAAFTPAVVFTQQVSSHCTVKSPAGIPTAQLVAMVIVQFLNSASDIQAQFSCTKMKHSRGRFSLQCILDHMKWDEGEAVFLTMFDQVCPTLFISRCPNSYKLHIFTNFVVLLMWTRPHLVVKGYCRLCHRKLPTLLKK